jgi:hypothetical protein
MSLPKVQVNLLLFLLFGSFAPCQTPTQPLVDQESQHSPLRVPDGTMVVLRFAEPLVGVPQYQVPASLNHAKKGDLVRLVVVTDLRIEDVFVIRKGSLAQAAEPFCERSQKWKHLHSRKKVSWGWAHMQAGPAIVCFNLVAPVHKANSPHRSGKRQVNARVPLRKGGAVYLLTDSIGSAEF